MMKENLLDRIAVLSDVTVGDNVILKWNPRTCNELDDEIKNNCINSIEKFEGINKDELMSRVLFHVIDGSKVVIKGTDSINVYVKDGLHEDIKAKLEKIDADETIIFNVVTP